VKPGFLLCFAALFTLLQAQDSDPKQRARAMRDLAKQGEDSIPRIAPSLTDPDVSVRVEAVKALVVLRPGTKADAAELIALVRARKGPVYAPKSVEFVERLPMTAVGKADKKVLRAKHWAGRERLV